MLISQLIYQLEKLQEKHGDLDVMFQNDEGYVWNVTVALHDKVEEDEFPLEWNMPEGYEFIKLSN